MVKHISCDSKCKFNSRTCSSNQKWNNETCQCEFKNYPTCNIIKLSYIFVRIANIADTSVITCDICYGYCINNNDKYYSKKCINKFWL